MGKILGYPALVLVLLTVLAMAYLSLSNKETATPNIRVENASLRLPAPGQTTASAYFDIINDGGADELLLVSTPISDRVELHTHIHEEGIMKMRRVKSVKIMPLHTTKFERMGLHVMIFNAQVPPNTQADTQHVPLTLTFARPPVPVAAQKDADGKTVEAAKVYTITVSARVED